MFGKIFIFCFVQTLKMFTWIYKSDNIIECAECCYWRHLAIDLLGHMVIDKLSFSFIFFFIFFKPLAAVKNVFMLTLYIHREDNTLFR